MFNYPESFTTNQTIKVQEEFRKRQFKAAQAEALVLAQESKASAPPQYIKSQNWFLRHLAMGLTWFGVSAFFLIAIPLLIGNAVWDFVSSFAQFLGIGKLVPAWAPLRQWTFKESLFRTLLGFVQMVAGTIVCALVAAITPFFAIPGLFRLAHGFLREGVVFAVGKKVEEGVQTRNGIQYDEYGPLKYHPDDPSVSSAQKLVPRGTILYFCGNGYSFKESNADVYLRKFGYQVRAFNYPALNGASSGDHMIAAVNAGIDQVYAIIAAEGLSWDKPQQIIQKCKLYGHSTGGAIALNVALHFKQVHGIDLSVILDRSLSSFAAAVGDKLHRLFSVPFWFAENLSQAVLYAGGNLNIDSMTAYNQLNPEAIDYFNVVEAEDQPEEIELTNLVATGAAHLNAHQPDVVIGSQATFAAAVAHQNKWDWLAPLIPTYGEQRLRELKAERSPHALVPQVKDGNWHGVYLEGSIFSSVFAFLSAPQGMNAKSTIDQRLATNFNRTPNI